MKILQNQARISTPPYSEHVTTLPEAMKRAGKEPGSLEDFSTGYHLYRLSGGYDAVVAVGHRPAFAFNLLCRVFGKRCRCSLAKEFYLEKDKRPAKASQWPRFLIKKGLGLLSKFAYQALDVLVINSSQERALYSQALNIPPERFEFLPWPSNVDPVDEPLPGTGYIFSAGRSHRDWDTFLEAVAGLDTPVKLVATKADMAGRTLPANVELHTDIPHKDYLELLKDAEVVVIPLVPMNRSTGQAAFLEAMAYGKPLVVTSVIGSADYIRDGVNGCLVPSQSPDALRDTLRKLMADERLRQGIGSAALQSIRSEFNKEVYSERFCTMVERHLGI